MTYKGHDDHEAQHTLHCFFIERLIGGERQTQQYLNIILVKLWTAKFEVLIFCAMKTIKINTINFLKNV